MPVSLTKREAEWLLGELTGTTSSGKSQRASVLKKLQATPTKRPSGLGVQQAVAALEAVMGAGSVAVPPSGTPEWYGKVGARIRQLGLTAEHCRRIGEFVMNSGWELPVALETLVWGAPKWLTLSKRMAKARAAPLPPEDL